MNITCTHDLQQLVGWARWVAADQVPFALAKALTRTAKEVEAAERKGMPEDLHAPTRFTLNANFVRPATKRKLEAQVLLKDTGDAAARQYLKTQIEGGTRGQKRFERALQAKGLMPKGFVAVPGAAAPRDEAGNVPRQFIVQLLSYLQAFSEQGYSANMTAKKKAKLADKRRGESGFMRINGVAYFVSHGKGTRFGKGSWAHGRRQHLAPGIWAKTGTHGAEVKPVFLFVASASYAPRFQFVERATEVINQRLVPNWRAAWHEALATRR